MWASKHIPFWFFTTAIFILLIIPILIQDGMFMDGVLYTAVSKNLGNGIGSFWFPVFSELGMARNATFHEHPPLVFWIQSLFFKVLGNSMYTERVYSLLTGVLNAGLIVMLWKNINAQQGKIKQMAWLPVLLWIIIPVSFMAFRNNMMENTMGIFTLAAVVMAYKGVQSSTKSILFLCLSGVMIFMGSFSKGVPAFFPLVIPIIHWMVFRRTSFLRSLLSTTILIGIPALIYALLLLYPDAERSLSIYVFERLLGRVGHAPTVDHRLFTLYKIFEEMIPALALTVLLAIVLKRKKIALGFDRENKKMVLFMFLVGLSASVPLMLTMVQKGWYITPALPYFAIALALIVAPGLAELIGQWNSNGRWYRSARASSFAFVVVALLVSTVFIGKTGRESDLLHDIHLIGTLVPENETINIDRSMWDDWYLQCYLIRYYNISVDPNVKERKYGLYEKTLAPDPRFTKIDLRTQRLDLYLDEGK